MDSKLWDTASSGNAAKLRSQIQEIPKEELCNAVNNGDTNDMTLLLRVAENGSA